MSSKLHIGILAAGKGSRMESTLPKVLHELNGKSLIDYVLETASKLNPESTTLVVGFKKSLLQKNLTDIDLRIITPKDNLIKFFKADLCTRHQRI